MLAPLDLGHSACSFDGLNIGAKYALPASRLHQRLALCISQASIVENLRLYTALPLLECGLRCRTELLRATYGVSDIRHLARFATYQTKDDRGECWAHRGEIDTL